MQVLNVDQRGKDTVVVVDEHKIVWLLEVERNDTHGECCIHTAGPLLWCTLSKVENLRKYVFFSSLTVAHTGKRKNALQTLQNSSYNRQDINTCNTQRPLFDVIVSSHFSREGGAF